MKRAIVAVFVLVFVLVLGGAALPAQQPSFTLQRDVIVDSAGYQRLELDPAILAAGTPFRLTSMVARGEHDVASEGLRDLRLFDDHGAEVPYLLVTQHANASELIALRPLVVSPTRYESGFEVDLREVRQVSLIGARGLPTPFYKRARVEGSGDRVHWTLLVAEGTLFDIPKEGRNQLDLEFTPGAYRFLRLTWDDRSSGRVPLPSSVVVAVTRFLVMPVAPPLTVPLTFVRKASEPKVSRYTVMLPGNHLPIAALRLSVGDSNVMRPARVFESRLVNGGVQQASIGAADLTRAAGARANVSALDVRIDFPVEDRVELRIDDLDNPPLDLRGITAVFAELPFIFFEAKAPGRLWARVGAPALEAPRYDLEALRDSVAGRHLVPARWGATQEIAAPAAASGDGIPRGGAPIDAELFRWRRRIRDRGVGLTVLRLDVAALAHSRLTDLRIVDSGGTQVPYLLEQLDGPRVDTLPPLERLRRGETVVRERIVSRYWLHLPFDSLRSARLVLRTPSRVFTRQVRLELPMPDDPRRPRGGVIHQRVEWSHANPETPAPPLTFELPVVGHDDIQIVVEEGDNVDLPLERPVLLMPGVELRFLAGGNSSMRLLYGRADIGAPEYDIALLGPRLVGVPANEAALDAEGAPVARATNAMPGRIFWGVLIAAVLVLLVIIGRLVKQGAPAGEKAG